MTTESPLFMSAEHVEAINERLAASPAVAEATATLSRSYDLAYELSGGPDGETVHWSVHLGRDGVRFSLEAPPSADLTFVGDHIRMVRASRAARAGKDLDPGVEVIGDMIVFEQVAGVMAAAQREATVPVRWPEGSEPVDE
ncbi:hypothetical protein [Sphaerisporangium sp. NPDC051011]|uniref:hypothetical protein n=1 Tax=Sphaerisporangium sp. NPDC051011 TaxID=3155792 RepID=UPI0033F04B8C